jgi:hypothetical protein
VRYEITTVRLDVTKNKMHSNNIEGIAGVSSLLAHGWELAGTVLVGEDVVVFMRHRRWRWKFWKKQEALPGKKAYAVYRK